MNQQKSLPYGGNISKRQDVCTLVRNTYAKIEALNNNDLSKALSILIKTIQNIINDKVPHENLVTNKIYCANYKSDTYPIKIFCDELRSAGKIINPGDRISFVVVKSASPLLGYRMKSIKDYEESLNTSNPYQLDHDYYINLLKHPISRLFQNKFATF